jgi:N-acetylglucosamine-6-sulfatase
MPGTVLRNPRLRPPLAVIALLSAIAGLVVSGQPAAAIRRVQVGPQPLAGAAPVSPPSSAGGAPVSPTGTAARPNIVFVLTDDLSVNLLPYMPQVQAMQRDGLTFSNYFVSDSLCCPSRSSIFSGNFPHDTGVFGNAGAHGGFHVFYSRGEEQHTFAVALQRAGYRTAMMGKYLNGYLNSRGTPVDVPKTYVPSGWSEWDVGGSAYSEFDYTLNENGALHSYGHRPADYLTDVIARKGVDFIHTSVQAGQPFFLELATFAPHGPYVPAPRDANDFPGLTAPRAPSFDVLPLGAPRWLAAHPPLSAAQIDDIDSVFRRRAQAVQAVNDMIGAIKQKLTAEGVAGNTYLVFSSDNGLHLGEYRLTPGKMTAFDTDIHVPLVVTGPGVPAGVTTGAMAENVDLAKTFSAIGGTDLPSDGHSLLALFGGQTPPDWRNAVLVEHHGPDLLGIDPDFQQTSSGNPRTYEAMRTPGYLYVEYDNGEREFYNLRVDPFELNNLAGRLSRIDLTLLHAELAELRTCHSGPSCWRAMHVDPVLAARHRR